MDKNFKLFLVSSACSLLSIEIFQLAIPLTMISLGYSAIETGWCTFAFFLPVILVKLFAAPIIENKNKKVTLLLSENGRVLCIVIFICALYFFDFKNLFYIIITSFVFGVFTTLTEVAEPAALKFLIGSKNSAPILTRYEIRTRSVQFFAPSLCGLLITYHILSPYLTICFASVLSVFLLCKIQINPKVSSNKKFDGIFDSIKEAFFWMKKNVSFTTMVLLTSINNFLHPVLYMTIIFSLKSMNVGYDITGYILSGLGIGGIIGSILAGYLSRRFKLKTLVLVVNILRIFVFAGFVFFPSPKGYFVFFILKAILGGIWNVCYNIYTIHEMPQEYVARISALSGILIKVSTAIGGILAGYFISYSGIEFTLYFLLALTLFMFISTITFKENSAQLSTI